MKILKKLEDVFAAAAFAEAGEFQTARELVREDNNKPSSLHKTAAQDESGQDHLSEHPSKA